MLRSFRRFVSSALLLLAACRTGATTGDPPVATRTMDTGAKPTSPVATPSSSPSSSSAPAFASAPPSAAPPSAEAMAADARRERAFAAKLHAALVKSGSGGGNLFVSPASVRFAFALLHAGAKGETAAELASVLGYVPESADVAGALASGWAALAAPAKEEWRRGEEVTIRSANRIFVAKTVQLLPAYVTAARDRYGAPAELLDFGGDPDGSRRAINAWVEQSTSGKIRDILAPGMVSPATKIALANAIYFKAAWQRAFEPASTLPGTFTTPTGKVQVPMMTQTGEGKVGDTSDAEVVELPYGRDFVMTIVLPRGQATLATLEASISEEKLRAWASASSAVPMLRLSMPKFRVESTLSLGDTMKALGVTRAFAYGQADFSGLDGTRELFVGTAIHKTFVAVDEKGTEAAAATVISMKGGAAPDPSKPRDVRVDRPFLFAIRDAKRDRLVFLGRVVDPTSPTK